MGRITFAIFKVFLDHTQKWFCVGNQFGIFEPWTNIQSIRRLDLRFRQTYV